MLKYLVPKIALRDLPVTLGFAFLGAMIAGGYGIVHDHVTFTIGPEYFTKLKFFLSHALGFLRLGGLG